MPISILVYGLFGHQTVRIPLDRRCLILVGPNGTGKSTIINIVFFILTAQWKKLNDIPFDGIVVEYDDGEDLAFSKSELDEFSNSTPRSNNYQLYYRRLRDSNQLDLFLSKSKLTSAERRRFTEILRVPERELTYVRNFLISNFDASDFFSSLVTLDQRFRRVDADHILFLPTYRRIERELQVILPNFGPRPIQRAETETPRPASFTESVGFGMADVKALIDQRSIQLRDVARQQLGELSISMVKELLSSTPPKRSRLPDEIDVAQVARMLDNFKPQALNDVELRALNDQIQELRGKKKGRGRPERRTEFLGSFIEHIYQISKNIGSSERDFLGLVSLLDSYFKPSKAVEYDPSTFSFQIVDKNNVTVDLDYLSSGEKQLVGLFTLLRLGQQANFRLIVDEPELSLSVQWQKRLLPDVLASNRCVSVLAATHSPSIFDNELDKYTLDVRRLAA